MKNGIDFTFVEWTVLLKDWMRHFKPNTKAVFGRNDCNPALKVLDIEKFARRLMHMAFRSIIANTFATLQTAGL